MAIAKPMRAVARQGIFSIRSSVPAVKPDLVPIFRVAMMFGMGEINFFPFFELTRHQALCWGHLRNLCGGSDERNPEITPWLVLLEDRLHRILESCIYLIWSSDRYLADGIGSLRGYPGNFLIRVD